MVDFAFLDPCTIIIAIAQNVHFEEANYSVMEYEEVVQVCVIANATGAPSETRQIAVDLSTVDGTAEGKFQ